MMAVVRELPTLVAQAPGFSRFLGLMERVDRQRPDVLRVLTYHRVDEPGARPALDPGLISAAPGEFARQMQYLSARYRMVSLAEVLAAFRSGSTLPPRSLLVTFDDAYCDFAEHAWPILKRCGVPAVLFVPTAYPDQPERSFWWDRLYHAVTTTGRDAVVTPLGILPFASPREREGAYLRLKQYVKTLVHRDAMQWVDSICRELRVVRAPMHSVLGWDALWSLAKEGVALGAHTQTHPLLTRVSPAEASEEIGSSFWDLEREIGTMPRVFAYPGGALNDEVVRSLEREGASLGFRTGGGFNEMNSAHPLRLCRLNVGWRSSLPVLRARLLSCFARVG